METIRISSLPRLVLCPADAHLEGVKVHSTSIYASEGTELSKMIDCYIKGLIVPSPSSYTVQKNFETFQRYWTQMNIEADDIVTEGEVKYFMLDLENPVITGHPDLYSVKSRLVIDWKSGWGEFDYLPQLIGYAMCLVTSFCDVYNDRDDVWTLAIINLATNTVQVYERTVEQIRYEFMDYMSKIRNWNHSDYYIGEQCTYCPSRYSCGANREMMATAMTVAGEVRSGELTSLSEDDMVRIYPLLGMAEKRIDAVKDMIKGFLREHNGLIESQYGTLSLSTVVKKTVLVEPSAGFLVNLFGSPEKLYSLLKLGKTDLDNALKDWYKKCPINDLDDMQLVKFNAKDEAVRFNQSEMLDEIYSRLTSLGAIEFSSSSKMTFKPNREALTQ